MKIRNRILLLSSLLLLVSAGGIGNLMWQMPHLDQMHDLKAILQFLILLGLFGAGLIFSVLELVRHEITSPIFHLADQLARLKERKIDGHRIELTGSKNVDLLTRALNDLLDDFQKKEDFYHILTEASPDMIFLLDRDGRVLFGNLNAARQWNYQAEEIIGKRQEELFPPDVAKRHKQVVQKIFETGRPVFVDVPEKIGVQHCWIDARMMPVLDEDGHVTAVLGISRDITERKQAEETLRESEQRYREVFDGIPDAVIVHDANGVILDANDVTVRNLETTRAALLGRRLAEFVTSANAAAIGAHTASVLSGEAQVFETTYVSASGKTTQAEVHEHRIQWKGGEAVQSSARNITERKRAEQKAAMLSDAIENAHHGCLIIAEDYKVVFGNNYALSKLGFDSDELKNLVLFSLCTDREQVKDIIETMKVAKRWMGEIAVVKKDGQQFPALVSVTALGADDDVSGGGGDVILFQDITIQKEMREKLLASERLAVMGRLVADVAHELNNPLAIIIGGTQLVLKQLDKKEPELQHQLERILRNGKRCKTILGNLLGYGRTVAKRYELINIQELIYEAIDSVSFQYDMRGIGTALSCDKLCNVNVAGNRAALLSVFINLIRNARQAMGSKGRLVINLGKQDDDSVRVEISDTGIGMSKEQMENLFKPFVSGWREDEGSGLGLATSLSIIETHGGKMTAFSNGIGQGTTFVITLPYSLREDDVSP